MKNIKAIHTETEYRQALAMIEKVMDAKPNTHKGERLEMLTTRVEEYEKTHYPIEPPTPVEAILHQMEALGMTCNDLQRVLGSKAKASDILNYKRPLTLPMIRRIHQSLHIPAESLIQSYSLK